MFVFPWFTQGEIWWWSFTVRKMQEMFLQSRALENSLEVKISGILWRKQIENTGGAYWEIEKLLVNANSALSSAETNHSKIASLHSLETCTTLLEPEHVAKKGQLLSEFAPTSTWNIGVIYLRDADFLAQWNWNLFNQQSCIQAHRKMRWSLVSLLFVRQEEEEEEEVLVHTQTISIISYLQKPEASKTCQKTQQKHISSFRFTFFLYRIYNNDAPQPIPMDNMAKDVGCIIFIGSERQNYVNLPTADDSPVVRLLNFGCWLDLVWSRVDWVVKQMWWMESFVRFRKSFSLICQHILSFRAWLGSIRLLCGTFFLVKKS